MSSPDEEPSEPQSNASEQYNDLGMEIRELTPELARQLGLRDATGVLVGSVQVDSPAYDAGLRRDDVIQKVGSKPVSTPAEFEQAVKGASLKDGVRMLVRNAGGTRFVVVKE